MIIPVGTSDKYKKGDKVVLTSDIKREYAIFCKGHKFKYIGKDEYGPILEDDNGVILDRIGIAHFTLDISLEQAKKEVKDRSDYYYFRSYMKDNCPHKDFGYEDRERYDICKIKKKYPPLDCIPCADCLMHIKKLDKRCSQYVRKLKLKKIDEKG